MNNAREKAEQLLVHYLGNDVGTDADEIETIIGYTIDAAKSEVLETLQPRLVAIERSVREIGRFGIIRES